ncbi:MAG: DNA/RNA nuclease SfsA [Hyphomicrobiales bacterium]|nr:DNA/RNA nuclease SfsA [Hyphomicrobiales bacterium]MCP5370710.1 DNA/RNA nuclease SfsA [Hyphomicrobiales bacterium]
MEFPDPLIKGRLVRRYKRFMADVELDDGSVVVAHCANSGSMLSVNLPGSEVWISPARNPDRKLRYTWEMARIGSTLVGINTGWPNALAAEAIAAGKVPELAGYASLRREVKYGRNSRIDLLLEDPERPKCYVEVKNVTMRRDLSDGAPVEFPDGVTARGTKHLGELADMVAEGHRAVMFYLVQREDADSFVLAGDLDPDYAAALPRAMAAGVEAVCYACRVNEKEIAVERPLRLDLG